MEIDSRYWLIIVAQFVSADLVVPSFPLGIDCIIAAMVTELRLPWGIYPIGLTEVEASEV